MRILREKNGELPRSHDKRGVRRIIITVSYTHLTLPTICSV